MSSALKIKSKGVTKTRRTSKKPNLLSKNFSKLTLSNSPMNVNNNINVNNLIERFKKLSIKKDGPWIVASQHSSLRRDGQLRQSYRYFEGQPFTTSALYAEERLRLDVTAEFYKLGKQENLGNEVILSVAHGRQMLDKRYFTVPSDTIVILMTYPDHLLYASQNWRNFLNPLYTRKGLDELFLGGKLERTLVFNREKVDHVQVDIRIPGDLCENLELQYQDPERFPHLGVFSLPFQNPRKGGIADFVVTKGNDDWPGNHYAQLNAVRRTLDGLVKSYKGRIILVNSCREKNELMSV
jgi:hypothetical protein